MFIRNNKMSEWNAHIEIQNNWEKIQKIPFSERNTSINNLIHEINIEFDTTKNVKLQNINYQNVFLPKHRDIFFIYENKYKNVGSTFMRGEQLCGLLSKKNDHIYNIHYSTYNDFSNKILFLTKGFLKETTPEILNKMRLKGNVILADFVDEPPIIELIDEIDILIASSIKSFIYYKMNWPYKQSAHVTHHVDPRISNFINTNKFDNAKIGYFGEIINTKTTRSISDIVEFVGVNCTNSREIEWMKKINGYNCHYAIRNKRKLDGFKPFLKGFVAAHCNANICIQRNESDAIYYLNGDYPFLVSEDANESEILDMLHRIKDSYGSGEWKYGLEVMRHVKEMSSDDFILNEFIDVIDSI